MTMLWTTLNVRFKLPVYKMSLAEKFLALKKKNNTYCFIYQYHTLTFFPSPKEIQQLYI